MFNIWKKPPSKFEESREIFLADIAAEVMMNEIPRELIINWDQTELSIISTGDWTMERKGAKLSQFPILMTRGS